MLTLVTIVVFVAGILLYKCAYAKKYARMELHLHLITHFKLSIINTFLYFYKYYNFTLSVGIAGKLTCNCSILFIMLKINIFIVALYRKPVWYIVFLLTLFANYKYFYPKCFILKIVVDNGQTIMVNDKKNPTKIICRD